MRCTGTIVILSGERRVEDVVDDAALEHVDPARAVVGLNRGAGQSGRRAAGN